mmetsp:Transcript_16742/g.44926  ORF Transcript_16742/g.44926 Transcript_16742/m.44926 type:complete len:226 (-) Transcript_16742:297-974(-)
MAGSVCWRHSRVNPKQRRPQVQQKTLLLSSNPSSTTVPVLSGALQTSSARFSTFCATRRCWTVVSFRGLKLESSSRRPWQWRMGSLGGIFSLSRKAFYFPLCQRARGIGCVPRRGRTSRQQSPPPSPLLFLTTPRSSTPLLASSGSFSIRLTSDAGLSTRSRSAGLRMHRLFNKFCKNRNPRLGGNHDGKGRKGACRNNGVRAERGRAYPGRCPKFGRSCTRALH